ncbi:acyl carrier protein, partial [Streptomyces sp. NPDC057474]|uniref:acyl carrier protein n=1 Tax=Streptomyces sp. NPDC057474 TaxID=3346144 RepID=UPI0036AB8EFA
PPQAPPAGTPAPPAGAAAPPAPGTGPGRAHRAVRAVWGDLLGDASDDAQFFEAGGDSILAMQMVSRLRREGFTLAMREIYRNPVLADLAAHLDTATTAPSADRLTAGTSA